MRRPIVFTAALSLLLATPAAAQPFGAALTLAGVPNFHRVDANLYRSGQPDISGFRNLVARYHIGTVVSLRALARDDQLLRGADLPLRLQRFPLHPSAVAAERDKIVAVLRAVRAGMRAGPTLIHCEHGSDRTGMIVALYRILYQGWSKQAALGEMRDKAFGFHAIWGNIPRFIETVDVAELKRQVEAPVGGGTDD